MAGGMNGMMTYGQAMPSPMEGEHEAQEDAQRIDDKATIVQEVRDNIEDSYLHDQANRIEAETDLEFLSGNHWPANIRSAREAADRPVLTINRLPQFVRQITNDIRQADIAIKASPEDDETDPALAEVYDALLRLIQYQSSAKHVYATAAEHQAGCGIGHFRITTRYTDDETFDQELQIKAIQNPLSVFWDPAAVMPDRSDAMWCAVTETIPRKTYKRRYPGKVEASVDSPFSTSSSGLTWASQDDVMVAEYWCKKPYKKWLVQLTSGETVDLEKMQGVPGFEQMVARDQQGQPRLREVECHKVIQYVVSGTEVLEGPNEWSGKYIPIVPVIGGEWPLQNQTYRYGAIRFARDPAQLYNQYRSSQAEVIALQPKSPWLVSTKMIGAFKSIWDRAGKANFPYLPYEPDDRVAGSGPRRESPPQMSVAMSNEAAIAADEMKAVTGIYDASLGAKSNETSGVAIGRRDQQGDTANYHFVDNLQRSLEYAGRVLIDLIPKIYDNERVIRLLGDGSGKEEFVPINTVQPGPDGMPVLVNDLSAAKFDVRVTMGRSYATKRIEAQESMSEFIRAMPDAAPLIADLFAKAMDWPEADEISKRLKAMIPPQALQDPDAPPPPPDPAMEEAKQMATDQAKSETRKAIAEADKAEAEAGKAHVELQVAQATIPAQVLKSNAEAHQAANPPEPKSESYRGA